MPEHIVKGFDESKVPLERLSPAIVAEYLKENADSVLSVKMKFRWKNHLLQI